MSQAKDAIRKKPRRKLPVAEPTYSPPKPKRSGAGSARWVGGLVAGVVLVGVMAVAVMAALPLLRAATTRTSPAGVPEFSLFVDEYYGRAFEGPGGPQLYARLAALASLEAGRFGAAHRPAGPAGTPAVRILGVQRRRAGRTLSGEEERDLLFVAYEAEPAADLPRTRAPEAALAFVASGYSAYPGDAVVLLHWTGGEPAGQVRLYPVDFASHATVGVVIAAVDPDTGSETDSAVAFALGDPVQGTGRIVSQWMPLNKSS